MAGYKLCRARVSAAPRPVTEAVTRDIPGAGTVRVIDCHVACSGWTIP
jgi:hypothetical protein